MCCALFVVHTYAFDLGDVSPILFITGPTKRCGKSRLLSLLARMVNRPLQASSASAAGLYRAIELHHPTLLIDEVDSFLTGDEQLRGLVNSGHTRDAAFHLGCYSINNDIFPRRWSTWTPKAFSGIGRIADTIEDRAFIIHMRRRRKDEKVARLSHATSFEDIRRKCARFVVDHSDSIHAANPDTPEGLNDRAADNWRVLLVLADLAGNDWPAKVRRAALALSGVDETESLGLRVQLLVDIRQIFSEVRTSRLASKELCEKLAEMEGAPWAEYGKSQRPISPNQLAILLRNFGITPRNIRIGESTPKGYPLEVFEDTFSRYLREDAAPNRYTATKPVNTAENACVDSATPNSCGISGKPTFARADAGCGAVALQEPETDGPQQVDGVAAPIMEGVPTSPAAVAESGPETSDYDEPTTDI